MSCRLKGEHKTGILLVFRLSLPLPASRDVREAELMRISEAINEFDRYAVQERRAPTRVRYRNDLRILCLSLNDMPIEGVNKHHILDHIEAMRRLGWHDKSLFQKISAYRCFFKFLQKHGYSSLDPELLPRVTFEYVEPRVATDEEYRKILEVIPDRGMFNIRNRAMVMMLWDTGMRVGELVSLDLDALPKSGVGIYSATIRGEKKRNKPANREVFWSEATHRVLLEWLEVRAKYAKNHETDPRAVFISLNSGKGERMKLQGPEQMLTNYSKKAGLRTVNPHSFRHAKARRIIEAGGTNSDVMNILGHSSLTSSQIYTVMFGNRLSDRAAKFL